MEATLPSLLQCFVDNGRVVARVFEKLREEVGFDVPVVRGFWRLALVSGGFLADYGLGFPCGTAVPRRVIRPLPGVRVGIVDNQTASPLSGPTRRNLPNFLSLSTVRGGGNRPEFMTSSRSANSITPLLLPSIPASVIRCGG